MLRRIEIKLFTLAAIACLAIAGTANAGITVDIEWSDGGTETSAAASSTVTAEFFVTATGSTTIGGYQFSITWDSTELTYIDNPPIGPSPANDDSLNNSGPAFPRSGSWTTGGAGELFLANGGLTGPISASTLTVVTDSIIASDGKVSVGTVQFHVENGVVDDGAADVGGCYDCLIPVGDGSFGTGDITTTFNGAGINAPAGAVCGDGVTDAGEECDDGNTDDGDACRSDCTLPVCGDGIVDADEECDDGNNDDTDFCSNSCVAAACGDATTNGNEECDDGNTNDVDFCSNSCTLNAFCGDGVTEGSEECDDGNTDAGDGCSASCTNEVCGNFIIDAGEECDDGNILDGDGCDSSCNVETFCGDGNTDTDEECDDGNTNDNDACRSDCTLPGCGDGIVDAGEECDDGNNDDTDFCSNSCIAAVCGDATTNGDEECDDGNADETDFCSNSCIAAVCGDGVVNGHDECDDGNTTNGDGCDSTCDLEDECGGDSTPPDIDSVTASPDVLWPPNHKMVSVAIAVSATDNCDPAPTCQVISVASNEPVTGKGDKTSPDWDVTGDLSLDLRAERSGKGSGRVYTATVECTDSLGNDSSEDVSVTVPHNQ